MILDLSAIASLQEAVGDLKTEGWSFFQEFHRLRVERAVASPADARHQLQRFGDALTVLLVDGTYGDFRVGLKLLGTSFEVVSLPEGSLERFFEETVDRELARRLEEREAEAAFAMPLAWYATADVDLSRALPSASGHELRVVASSQWITQEITGAGVDGISRFVPEGRVRRIYVALEGPAEDAHFGSVSFAGPQSALDLANFAEPLPGEENIGSDGVSLPTPAALMPSDPPILTGEWSNVATVFAAAFVASTWQRIATSVREDGKVVEFLGFKRVAATLPTPEEVTVDLIRGTQRLYQWAFQDLSPDRLLAVRQVVSLYQDRGALFRPTDVLESAEVVFVGLRTEAVAEVLKGTREALTQAGDTVRQSLKATQDLTKSAIERVLASLVAIAAVVAANATRTLSDSVSRNLLLLVALFLAMLAASAVVLEGPLLALPLKNLKDDLREGNPLLTENQRERAASLPSVVATNSRVRLVRVVVPLMYVGLAVMILVWGYPQNFV